MDIEHGFSVRVATEFGVNEAILIKNFQHWILKNKANRANFRDGRTWTYNSIKAFEELFPYLSIRAIRTALEHLTEKGVLMTANYNEKPFDRTLWYAFVNEERWICQNEQMDLSKTTNGFVKMSEPIPNNKPNNITTTESASVHTCMREGIERVREWICDNEDAVLILLKRCNLIQGLVTPEYAKELLEPYIQAFYEQLVVVGKEDVHAIGRLGIKSHFQAFLPKYIRKQELEQQQKQQEYEQGVDPITRAMQDFAAGWDNAERRKQQEKCFERF